MWLLTVIRNELVAHFPTLEAIDLPIFSDVAAVFSGRAR
jgi:hypothetical protein